MCSRGIETISIEKRGLDLQLVDIRIPYCTCSCNELDIGTHSFALYEVKNESI